MARETSKSTSTPPQPTLSTNSSSSSQVLVRFEEETSGDRLALVICGQTIRCGSGASKREALDAALASKAVDLRCGVS